MTRTRTSRLDGYGFGLWRLAPQPAAVYLWICEHPGCSAREVAAATGLAVELVYALLEQLEESEHVADDRGRLYRRGPS